MRIVRDGKEIELTPEELNRAYKEQTQKIAQNNKIAVEKLKGGQEFEFHPIRSMYRIRLDKELALRLLELMEKAKDKFVSKPILIEKDGQTELAFDKRDLPILEELYKELTHDELDSRAVQVPDYEPIDIYQKSPGFMAGMFNFHDERVHFELDRRDGTVIFEPHDFSRLAREGMLDEAAVIAQIMSRDYVREAIDVVRASRTPDEIAMLYHLKDRDMTDPLMKELRDWDLNIAYNDYTSVYMSEISRHDPAREMEQVNKLLYAVSLMDRGMAENDERCMSEGFSIAGDALSAITHNDIKLSKNPSTMELVRDIAERAQADVRQYIEEGNPGDTRVRDHIESSMQEHNFFDHANGDREHTTTTHTKSVDIER